MAEANTRADANDTARGNDAAAANDTVHRKDGVVLAIDAGTTGIRTIAFDPRGRIVDSEYREFAQHFPQPGWVEHDAGDILEATLVTLRAVVGRTRTPIAAIGITNQRETVLAWNRDSGEIYGRAIVWQDRRTAEHCEQLARDGATDLVRQRTGLVLDPYFSGTKLAWLLKERQVPVTSALALGTVDSWLLWNLTGGTDGGTFATEPSNACRTMLFDITTGRWSSEMCELLGVPIEALATVQPSAGRFGMTRADGPLGAALPISGIGGDQQAALFGQACLRPGMAKNTYGTGSFVLMNVGSTCPEPSPGLLTSVAWTVPGSVFGSSESTVTHYVSEGAIFVTGAAVQWLRDGLGVIDDAAETGALAASVESSDGVVIVPAFTGLGSPWWNPHARGAVFGLTRGSNRAHLARAVVESMVLQTRDVVDAMTAAAGEPLRELRIDGGASAMDLLVQLQADQLGVPVRRSTLRETTALGAAFLAGIAEGVWPDVSAVESAWSSDLTAEPGDAAARDAAERLHEQWLRAIDRVNV
jgi:glycerol kinase